MEWAAEDTLTSGQRKLKRGIEQVKTLCREASAFENDEAYVFETESQARSAQEVEYRCFAVQRKTMPDHWPLLAGEAIQNLRASLDHLVYEKSGGNRRTQFPIFTDRCEFQVLGKRYLKGVPEAVRAFIEKAQPYKFMPEDAAHHPLAQLSALSNLDKHRVLAAVVSAVTKEAVGKPSGVGLTWEELASNKPLGAGKGTHLDVRRQDQRRSRGREGGAHVFLRGTNRGASTPPPPRHRAHGLQSLLGNRQRPAHDGR